MSEKNGNNSNGNGHKPNEHNKQAIKKPVVKNDPSSLRIAREKTAFIAALRKNGGNVSGALITSKLKRVTAYDHFKNDKVFADAWLDALEASNDDLYKEAVRRAKTGILEPVYHNGKKIASVKKYSDTLLIFLLKQSEAQKKWRNRIIKAGNLAVETVRDEGKRAGLSEAQIIQIQNKMVENLNNVSLV